MGSELAIKGGNPVRTTPFTTWPFHDERERELLFEVLESGVWSFGGPKEAEFAKRFSDFCGAAHTQCVANGSVSLVIALRALGVGPGDEVLVPALTWTATAWAAVEVGATPVFCDVRSEDWCIDPLDAGRKIAPTTRAIIPVHLYNQIAEMDEILSLARRHSLWVIEDCAHAHGSRWGDRSVGTLGHLGSFSFQQTKGITSGEGGAVITNDDTLSELVYGLKNCGRPIRPGSRTTFGGNFRITDLQAAILLAQLERLPVQLKRKAQNIARFRTALSELPGLHATQPKDKATRQGLYAVSLTMDPEEFCGIPRDVLVNALLAEGIPVLCPYEVVYSSALWINGRNTLNLGEGADMVRRLGLDTKCSVAESISGKRGVTIPHQVFLGDDKDIDDVVEAFNKVRRHASSLRGIALEKKARSTVSGVLKSIGIRL